MPEIAVIPERLSMSPGECGPRDLGYEDNDGQGGWARRDLEPPELLAMGKFAKNF
jgi:hypothetical protein